MGEVVGAAGRGAAPVGGRLVAALAAAVAAGWLTGAATGGGATELAGGTGGITTLGAAVLAGSGVSTGA